MAPTGVASPIWTDRVKQLRVYRRGLFYFERHLFSIVNSLKLRDTLPNMDTLFDKVPDPSLLFTKYLEFLATERSASPHTLSNYERDLRIWYRFLFESGVGDFLERVTDLKLLRKYLAEQMLKFERSTVNRRLSAVKGYLKFLHRDGWISKNVGKLLSLPRVEPKLPQVLKEEEINQLILQIPKEGLKNQRARAIAELLYSTGIRVSELVDLEVGHVDLSRAVVLVRGKGNKERVVPLGRPCQAALSDYIRAIPPAQQAGLSQPLFLNREGGRISVRTVQRELRRIAVEALGTRGAAVSPHTFRHSCATHLLSAGAGLREIQEFLGHESLVTTQKYTQVDIDRLKKSYYKAHPREVRKRHPKSNA